VKRRTFLAGLSSALISLGFSRGDSARSPQAVAVAEGKARYEESRREAIAMNDLAGNIHSLADARALVDLVAKVFAEELPPMWGTRAARNRVARAEYRAVADPAQLLPEQRVADVWNAYVREIDAPEEMLVNIAEIYNLRDAYYSSGQFFWQRGNRSIWTMPNIYATAADGKLADGCRALESLRVLWDLGNQPRNLQAARERVSKGMLASEELRQLQRKIASGAVKQHAEIRSESYTNPVSAAERRYTNERGSARLMTLAEGWFEDLFPA
jgi:hypothetical protein